MSVACVACTFPASVSVVVVFVRRLVEPAEEAGGGGGEDAGVVFPVEAVFAPEVVLDGVGVTEGELDSVDFAPSELRRG